MVIMKAYAVRRARTYIEIAPLHQTNSTQQSNSKPIYQARNEEENQLETPFSTPICNNFYEPSIEPLAARTSKIIAISKISSMKKA